MATVGSYQAKTHLPALLERVERGEKIIITKRGRPMAMLVPITPTSKNVKQIVREMLDYQKQHGPRLGKDLSIRDLIEEGRH